MLGNSKQNIHLSDSYRRIAVTSLWRMGKEAGEN
jgi:hypothetical protein